VEDRTWHHGLVARWWAEINEGGDDVAYFRSCIERAGEPVLDAGCGTGRILLPLLRAAVDIDGSDVSEDMLSWCEKSASEEALSVKLYRQAMHELDLPRRYRTIIVCGAFGVGSTRAEDLEGLRRLHRHLEPGGTLFMDHHLPNVESRRTWQQWIEEPSLPAPWPEKGMRGTCSDGSELELRTRTLAFDPLEQTTTLEMRAALLVDGVETQVEHNTIEIGLYFKHEIELMLSMAGFSDVAVSSFAAGGPPRPWRDQRIVFTATR